MSLIVQLNKHFRGKKAINCSSFLSLLKKQLSGMFQCLPTAAKRSLLKSFVIVGTANKEESVQNQYWQEVSSQLNSLFVHIS